MSRVLGRIRALHFPQTGAFAGAHAAGPPRRPPNPFSILGWKWDPSVVAHLPGRRPPRGNGKHDDAEREHRKSHEFKHQRVHGNPPNETDRFVGKELTVS